MEKKCSVCKIHKETSKFRSDKSRKDGLSNTCNECSSAIQRNWYSRNKEKARKQAKKRYESNKDQISAKRKVTRKKNAAKIKEQRKLDYQNNKDIHRERSWKRAGIKNMTVSRYNELFKSQKGCCAICATKQDDLKRSLCVDHNHSTGEVRGLLCDACNRALGYLKDSTDLLSKCINYLNK